MFCPTFQRDRKFRWNRKRSKREEAAWRDPGHQSIYRCLLRISCFPHQVTEAVCFASLAKRPKNTSFITCQIFQLSRRQLQKLISLLFNTKVRHHNMLQWWCAFDEFEFFFLPRLLIRHFGEQMRMYNQVSAKFCSKPQKSWSDYERQHLSLALCWVKRSSQK